MKTILFNGSRRENGCTYTALKIIADVLEQNGIETEIMPVGKTVYDGKIDEAVKEAAEKVKTADAVIVGSPVYYASPSGEVIAFLDRLFMAAEKDLKHKPAAAIASARRAGTTASLDVLNKYFNISEMPIVSSRYWNMVHGSAPADVMKDEEGIQIMERLGRNMAWILKSIEAGKAAGVAQPEPITKKFTNFIR